MRVLGGGAPPGALTDLSACGDCPTRVPVQGNATLYCQCWSERYTCLHACNGADSSFYSQCQTSCSAAACGVPSPRVLPCANNSPSFSSPDLSVTLCTISLAPGATYTFHDCRPVGIPLISVYDSQDRLAFQSEYKGVPECSGFFALTMTYTLPCDAASNYTVSKQCLAGNAPCSASLPLPSLAPVPCSGPPRARLQWVTIVIVAAVVGGVGLIVFLIVARKYRRRPRPRNQEEFGGIAASVPMRTTVTAAGEPKAASTRTMTSEPKAASAARQASGRVAWGAEAV